MDSPSQSPSTPPTTPTPPPGGPAPSNQRTMILIIAAVVVVIAAIAIYLFSRSEPATPVVSETPTTEAPATPATPEAPAAPETPAQPETAAPSTPTPPEATPTTPETAAPLPSPTVGGDIMTAGPLGDKWLGNEDAPVTIIEYASMTCPHCAHFHATAFPTLKSKYIDTGKVRFIFREFPLDSLAAGASMLARCAPSDNFFPLVDLMFDKQEQWAYVDKPLDALFALVRQAGFTQESFRACLSNQQILDGITWVRTRASEKFGVDSTPTFFINGEKHPGALEVDQLEALLDPLISKQ